MRVARAEAILLDTLDLQEKDRIVAFLTREEGQKRGVARAARTKFSRFAGVLQVPSRVEVEWVEKENRDLVRVSDVRVLESWKRLHADLDSVLVASYCAEQARVFAQENEGRPLLFRLLDRTFEALDGGVDPDVVARYFEVWLLRLEGIFPVPDACPWCGSSLGDSAFFTPTEASVVCTDCAGAAGRSENLVSEPVLALLRATRHASPGQLASAGPPRDALRGVEEVCARVRRHFLGHEVRSYRVLRSTLSAEPVGGA